MNAKALVVLTYIVTCPAHVGRHHKKEKDNYFKQPHSQQHGVNYVKEN